MALIRGNIFSNVVACYDEAVGGGDMFDINAPRNAPAKTPSDYLDKLIWHQRCFQYEMPVAPADVAITHAALATANTYYVVSAYSVSPGGPTGPGTSEIGFVVQGANRITDILLLTHGLGYVPKFMVSLDGRRVCDGFVVYSDASGSHFRVSVFATATGIYLRESAVATNTSLAAVAKTYRVMVFVNRAPDPSKPMFGKAGAAMTLGRGIIDTSRRYLRRTGSGDSPFALNLGTTLDIKNGGSRSASGGVVSSEPRYNGSMAAPPFISVGV